MSNKNSYDVRAFNKSLVKLVANTTNIAATAVSETVAAQTESTSLSFDEIEAVPFTAATIGTIVLSVANYDPIALEQLVSDKATETVGMLKTAFVSGMQEVIR